MVLYYLFVNGYTLAILWGRDCFFIFDSHSRDSSEREVVNETAVLLKFLTLHQMDDYIKRTYFQQNSSYFCFQVQFVQIKRSQSKQTIQMSQYHSNDEEWICKVVQATHHQRDAKYGESRGMQCSCMARMSVGWTLLKPISRQQTSHLHDILLNLLLKSINKLWYLDIDDIPNILKIKNSFLKIEYLETKTSKFVVKEYLTTTSEIISPCQFRSNGAMLFVNSFTLGIIWNKNSFCLFDSHSRD